MTMRQELSGTATLVFAIILHEGETEAQKKEAGSRWVSLRPCGLRLAFVWVTVRPQ